MLIAGYLLSVIIGISLGLIGGGGSILTVPILVYLFGITPVLATGYSLFIVGITALVGALRYARQGFVNMKTTLLFAIPSLLSLILTRQFLLPAIPDEIIDTAYLTVTKNVLIMFVFAALMVTASISMIHKQKAGKSPGHTSNTGLSLIGLGVGVVTGFLGAGGGFLIIPALVFFAGLDMKQAVGTSLFIISINSLLGFMHDVIAGEPIAYSLLFSIAACAIAGMVIGTILSKKIPGEKLKPAFGWFVLCMGLYILTREIFF